MRQTTLTQSGAPGRVIGWTTLALNAWISSKFSALYWICLLFTFLISVGVELPLCIVVTIPECCNLFSGIMLNMRSFILILLVLSLRT